MTSSALQQPQPRVIAFPTGRAPAANPAGVYLARLAPSSRRTMRWALGVIAELLAGRPADPMRVEWAEVGYAEVVAIRAHLAERYAPATANRMLAALKGTLRESWRLGQMPAEAYYRAVDVPAIRGQAAPRGRALAEAEIAALLAACGRDASPAGARDAAIVAVLLASGLRRAELAALELADWEPASGALVVREGKGRKGRRAYAAAAAGRLSAWLEVRGDRPGPLVVPIGRWGELKWRHLSGSGIWWILRRRAREAGVEPFGPHDLRRTWIGALLDAGADLATAQGLAGHANATTTARYDRRGERARRRASALLRLPTVGGNHADHDAGEDGCGRRGAGAGDEAGEGRSAARGEADAGDGDA